MRNVVFALVLCSVPFTNVFSAEKTSLNFAFEGVTYVNNKEVKVSISKLNKKLNDAGLDGIPEQFSVSGSAKPFWRVIVKRIEAANELLGVKIHTPIESGYFHEYPPICYKGSISGVPAMIHSMLGSFLTDEQEVMALRYGKKKIINSNDFKTDEELVKVHQVNNKKEVRAWLNYDESSVNVLVMSNLGAQGDGTELYATVIKPCE